MKSKYFIKLSHCRQKRGILNLSQNLGLEGVRVGRRVARRGSGEVQTEGPKYRFFVSQFHSFSRGVFSYCGRGAGLFLDHCVCEPVQGSSSIVSRQETAVDCLWTRFLLDVPTRFAQLNTHRVLVSLLWSTRFESDGGLSLGE